MTEHEDEPILNEHEEEGAEDTEFVVVGEEVRNGKDLTLIVKEREPEGKMIEQADKGSTEENSL